MLGRGGNNACKNSAGMSDKPRLSLEPLKNMGVEEDEDVKLMLQGSTVEKLRSHWGKTRRIRLLEDGVTVWVESNKTSSKAKSQQSFSITEVECVREGLQQESLRRLAGSAPEGLFLTVVFRGDRKSLEIRCHSDEEARRWARGIRTLQDRHENMTHKDKLDHWIYGYLRRADQNLDGKLSYEEVQSLLTMMNITLSDQYARSLFQKCDRSGDNSLNHSETEEFCRELLRRPALDEVFKRYSANGCVLSTVDLRDFLRDQGEDASLVHAQSLILTYELNDWAQKHQYMTPNGFTVYMLSRENSVLDSDHVRVYQDMTRPLAHYFINSSHNTYLTKDQLTGDSSTEPYIRALNHGCRCVELDCWDGDKEPVIYHGHTLTSKVPFAEVIHTINEYAFKTSVYPLILSLENHCSVAQQTIMAQTLRRILGDKLLTKHLDGPKHLLPSPEDLKGKILIKAKKMNEEERRGPQNELSKLSVELSDLVIYTRSVHFDGFDQTANKPATEMSSFSESEALKHIRDNGKYFVRHNSHQLSRIYPSGQRVSSSNYDPQDMWNGGCQIVALNFQTPGEQMDLNLGRFLPNGRCGYVLKPWFMTQPDCNFNPENTGGGPGHNPTLLTIRVISAQQLPKPEWDKPSSIVDPQVWVEIHGVPIDNAKQKTARIDNNGFNPRWETTFNFTLHCPDLCLVRFMVEDHDYTSRNDFLGQFTLPFTSLRTGYRHVRLRKADGSSLSPSSLFVHVKISAIHNGHVTPAVSPVRSPVTSSPVRSPTPAKSPSKSPLKSPTKSPSKSLAKSPIKRH